MRLTVAAVSTLGCLLALGDVARAQTGGSSGTVGLTSADVFLGVREQPDVNLPERDIPALLNRANCLCSKPVYLYANILASSVAKAATISSSASVSIYVGASCNSATSRPCCKLLKQAPFSDFRGNGLTALSSVRELARNYDIGTNCTPSEPADANACIAGPHNNNQQQFSQTFWILISSTGGDPDVLSHSRTLPISRGGFAGPTNLDVRAANEALVLSWDPVNATLYDGYRGYQVLCTRADSYQVFKSGTFEPGFDSCAAEQAPGANPIESLNEDFVCSGTLSISSTSHRLKILENGIPYGVAVVAVDSRRNASALSNLEYLSPVVTRDFYTDYRRGAPEGAAEGGFCAVAGGAPNTSGAVSVLAPAAGLLALAAARRRRRGNR
jgi:hypothetical protein